MSDSQNSEEQLLHLVFGGELIDLQKTKFEDLDKLDIIGIFPNYKTAFDAWRGSLPTHGRQRKNAIFHCASTQNSGSRNGRTRLSAHVTYLVQTRCSFFSSLARKAASKSTPE